LNKKERMMRMLRLNRKLREQSNFIRRAKSINSKKKDWPRKERKKKKSRHTLSGPIFNHPSTKAKVIGLPIALEILPKYSKAYTGPRKRKMMLRLKILSMSAIRIS
jgi:hypothetical protein